MYTIYCAKNLKNFLFNVVYNQSWQSGKDKIFYKSLKDPKDVNTGTNDISKKNNTT